VHNLLAAEGFPPKLFAVEDLAGGWKMVVMEFLLYSDCQWMMLEMKEHSERLRYKGKVWQALSVIHGKEFVHGDFRGPNIFVSNNGDVKLIDFDHCGRHEQGRYPREWTIGTAEKTPRRAISCERSMMFCCSIGYSMGRIH
ncbi:hypothetical protein BC826DRAFT_995403, partial [Russula brevipes]